MERERLTLPQIIPPNSNYKMFKMFRSRSWFFASSPGGTQSSLWKPKNPHSIEYLKYLHSVLSRNQTVTDSNKPLLVEALRSITEILIWGDQNDPGVFDFFLEKNMLSYFLRIMKQKCGSYVCVQILQTLNILFENIRNQTSIYYLLSNNHVNSIIEHKFDFSDEEVMAYYISFLKTLSLRLNSQTIHFFYNEHTNDFPLYTEAIKFFNHPESMVRIAVRTLTLNVFGVDDASMQNFIRDKTASPYFSNLAHFISNKVLEIDKAIKSCHDDGTIWLQTKKLLQDLIAEHLDYMHYVNDIILLEIKDLNSVLVDQLLEKLILPVYVESLLPNDNDSCTRISKPLSLFLITQIFLVFHDKLLLEGLEESLHAIDLTSLLDTSENDYLAFFVHCLNYVRKQPSDQETLQTLIDHALLEDDLVRIATLCVALEHLDSSSTISISYSELLARLRNYVKTEEIFLELFEDEYSKGFTAVASLLCDPVMLLPRVGSPLSSVALDMRNPCGEEERLRRCIRIFFLLRKIDLRLKKEQEKSLPLGTPIVLQLERNIDLTNSDILACTLTVEGKKLRRFLVVDVYNIILVEPSSKRIGWGVVKFFGYIQDVSVSGDSDPRSLLITVKSSPLIKQTPALHAKFTFDDHIRCMAARQRLVKGRDKAREKKLHQIIRLLDNKKHSPPQNLRRKPLSHPPGTAVVDHSAANNSTVETVIDNAIISNSNSNFTHMQGVFDV